jgi:hypothetical protein
VSEGFARASGEKSGQVRRGSRCICRSFIHSLLACSADD